MGKNLNIFFPLCLTKNFLLVRAKRKHMNYVVWGTHIYTTFIRCLYKMCVHKICIKKRENDFSPNGDFFIYEKQFSVLNLWCRHPSTLLFYFPFTLELPRRLGVVTTGVLLLSAAGGGSSVRSLVDFRYRNETTLSEHVRSSVEWDVCKTCKMWFYFSTEVVVLLLHCKSLLVLRLDCVKYILLWF